MSGGSGDDRREPRIRRHVLRVLCVLVVEDEMLVAMMLEGMLRDFGYRVIKAARGSPKRVGPRRLGGDRCCHSGRQFGRRNSSYKVADELRLRGVPFVFASGYDPGSLRADFHDIAVLRKPYMPHDVRQVVAEAIGARG